MTVIGTLATGNSSSRINTHAVDVDETNGLVDSELGLCHKSNFLRLASGLPPGATQCQAKDIDGQIRGRESVGSRRLARCLPAKGPNRNL